MSKRHELRQRARAVARDTDSVRRQMTGDSFQNLAARTGIGTQNMQAGSGYGFDLVSRNRVQMEAVYRSSWIAGMAVDVIAEDMTRAGIEIQSDMDPDEKEQIERTMNRMGLWDAMGDNIKWSRLYGGSIAVMMIDGQDVSTPLRMDRVGTGQFKGLLVLDRWLIQPSLEDLVTELGPDIGRPRYYTVVADAQALINQKIHYSRVIRLDGVELPYWQRIAENGWGQSVLERLWDRLLAFDSATQGASQLVYKAHLRTYKVNKLREIIATGGRIFEALVKQIEMIRLYQSNEGMTLMDGEDEFEAHQYSFSGLSDVILQFGQQLSGALQIPLVRLFGQSPAGLNSSGESDLRTYYDNVHTQQDRALRPGLHRVLDLISRSVLGKPLPDNFSFEFRPLWQLTDEQKANAGKASTDSVVAAFDAGLIDRGTALKEMRQSSHVTGLWSNITDEDIEEAENEPPPAAEGMPDAGELMNEPPPEKKPTGDSALSRLVARYWPGR
ncbi:DUF1073 domain-containing protein [Microvirgula aerodenitrificans]|uniref:DUF1073 domain-containing protein n=1 Tax=Microvirgula aerodenitrificans TaxID=57480 RepID=UPI00248E5AE2|nr:DUF1073 domain-containing protein [Microvirgula aerodenitrificans]